MARKIDLASTLPPRCGKCGSLLKLQPILRSGARGQPVTDVVYRCPSCSDIVLHPRPTASEAAAWQSSRH